MTGRIRRNPFTVGAIVVSVVIVTSVLVGVLIDPSAPSGDIALHVLLVAAGFILLWCVLLFVVLLPWAAIERYRASSKASAKAVNRPTKDGGSRDPPVN
jgi:uncharacterized membrane protein YhaH (DUF805 family)